MNTLTRQEMQGLAFEPQQPEIEQLDLVRYWRAIARNKWRILALVALVGLIATLYAYSLKPIYRATATVLVEGSRPKARGSRRRTSISPTPAARATTTSRSSKSSSRANSPSAWCA